MRCTHRISEAGSVLAVAVSARHIFAGLQDHRIVVHDLATYAPIAELRHAGPVLSLVLSPDGSRLFSSAGDSTVKVWDLRTFRCLHAVLSVYDVGDIFSTAYDEEGDRLYVACQNTSIQWVSLSKIPRENAGRLPHKFFDSLAKGQAARPRRRSSIDRELAGGTALLKIDEDDIVQYAHYSYVLTLHIGAYRGRRHLFSGGGDGAINVWSLGRPTLVASLVDESGLAVECLAQRDSLLLAGRSGGGIDVWELETGQLLRRIRAHRHDVLALAIAGDRLFSCAGTHVRAWSLAGRIELVSEGEGHTKTLCAATSPSGVIVTGGSDDDVAIWHDDTPAGTARAVDDDAFTEALSKAVSYRSVSGSDSRVEDCHLAAAYLKNLAASLGAEAELLPTQHNPVVCVRFKATTESARSVLYYGHYDVISAVDASWTTPPFELAGRNGYLYGRGVSDNKGPVLAALFAAHELFRDGRLAVDLTMLIEGEEESGSRGFRESILEAKRAGQLADHFDEVFLSNSYWLDDETPCLTFGLRGVIRARLTVSADLPDLHSGVEGGSVRESLTELVHLLASLTDARGRAAIPGFYDSVRGASEAERALYEAVARRTKRTSSSTVAETVASLERKWSMPSLTVHKLDVSGPGNATVIPSSASAQISIRIVPDQRLDDIARELRTFIESEFAALCASDDRPHNTLTVEIGHTADWWLSTPSDNAPLQRLSGIVQEVWALDSPPLLIREGGSIPMVSFLEKTFSAGTVLHFPMGQASDQAHLVDERLRLANLINGREIIRRWLS